MVVGPRRAAATWAQPALSVWPVLTPISPGNVPSRSFQLRSVRPGGICAVCLRTSVRTSGSPHGLAREAQRVPRSRDVSGGVEPVRPHVVRPVEPQLLGLRVHHPDEALDAPVTDLGGEREG